MRPRLRDIWADWLTISSFFALAVINTAFGYLLYNRALKVLTVLEMNAVLNLKPAGTALMSWLFLSETLGMMQVVGMSIVLVGAAATQRGDRC